MPPPGVYGKRNIEEENKPGRHYENQGPHISKTARAEEADRAAKKLKTDLETNAFVQLVSPDGELLGPQVDVPVGVTTAQLEKIVNQFLENDEDLPYSFFIEDHEVLTNLLSSITELKISTEQAIKLVYTPQSIFRVRAVTRCSGSIPGHSEPVIFAQFSPNSRTVCTGSGDTTVRTWDVDTAMPRHTMKGHKNWVLCVGWSPDGKRIASGSMDCTVRIWDAQTGQSIREMKQHKQAVTCLAWEPVHSGPDCVKLVTGGKDNVLRVWDTTNGRVVMPLTSHTDSITAVKWGGSGLIYSSSRDRSIKVWEASSGKLCRSLEGHGHWVNAIALSTDHVLRNAPSHAAERDLTPLERYQKVTGGKPEKLASGSDDHTAYLWEPESNKKPLVRLTGHQQQVNHLAFSPDARWLVTASWDKSVKLWQAADGKFVTTFRGHVGAVYMVCWSSDSRLLVSASKDSTMKVWDLRTKKLKEDLPGHADEVYAVDWSADGHNVASGSKDCLVKIWKH